VERSGESTGLRRLEMGKWILRIGVILVCVVLIVLIAAYLWFQHAIKKSQPQLAGEVSVSGIKENVEIIRDVYGIPHIFARNEPDLFFALGYAMAQDRMWQMDFYRRLGNGRLSEIFGEELVETDRYFRLLSAAGINREIPNDLVFMITAFTDGVNAYLTDQQDRLPMEFKLLRYEPEPWKTDDYLAILKVVNWSLISGWNVDLVAGKILGKVGEKKFREIFPVYPGSSPITIPEGSAISSIDAGSLGTALASLEKFIDRPAAGASNNWVVSGIKSAGGKPLLANDPHLSLTNPSFWWEGHIVCPTINVYGYAIPGLPGIAMGQNRHVAWGVTNVMVDDVDFFIEKINPDNPLKYLYKGKWEDMQRVPETIRIKGKDPVETEILLTRHGPVLSRISEGAVPKAVAVKWAFTEGLQPAKAVYLLAKAKDIYDVKNALKYWVLPSMNFVFADTNGNIGYWCCATVPVRSKGDGFLPVPGWTGDNEWQGYVPFEERPHVINPEEGFFATANNKIEIANFPQFISHYYEPVDRITRIRQLLNSKEKLSVEDMQQMQQDIYCVLASELTPKIVGVIEQNSSNNDVQNAKKILSQWDFKMEADSVAACLFELTYKNMMENTFKDELGDELFRKYLATAVFPPRAIRFLAKNGSSEWFDDVGTPDKETMEDIIEKSVEQTIRQLKKEFGNDQSKWTWEKVHTLTFEHVLAEKKPLNHLFNIGPFPVGGNHLTVNKRQYPYNAPYHVTTGPSYRMIVDFSDMSNAQHVLPTGESGQLGSAHYKDQVDLYLSGRYHPAWIERSDIEKHAEETLILTPKKEKE
jgi:penicillin amidase